MAAAIIPAAAIRRTTTGDPITQLPTGTITAPIIRIQTKTTAQPTAITVRVPTTRGAVTEAEVSEAAAAEVVVAAADATDNGKGNQIDCNHKINDVVAIILISDLFYLYQLYNYIIIELTTRYQIL